MAISEIQKSISEAHDAMSNPSVNWYFTNIQCNRKNILANLSQRYVQKNSTSHYFLALGRIISSPFG